MQEEPRQDEQWQGPQSKKARLSHAASQGVHDLLTSASPQFESAAKDGTDREDERQTKRRRRDTEAISACGIKEHGKSPVQSSKVDLNQAVGGEAPFQINPLELNEGEAFFQTSQVELNQGEALFQTSQ